MQYLNLAKVLIFYFEKKIKKIQETCCSIYIYIGVRKELKIKTFGGIFRMAILTKRMFMNAHYKYRRSDVNIRPFMKICF